MHRRSSNRAPRKQYTVDAFASIPELQSGSESPSDAAGADSEDDFVHDAEAEPSEASDVELVDAVHEADSNDENEPDQLPTLHVVDAAKDTDELSDGQDTAYRQPYKRPAPASVQYIRGLEDGPHIHHNVGKAQRNQLYWGPASDAFAAVTKAIRKWNHLPVLPRREDGFHAPWLVDQPTYNEHYDSQWELWSDEAILDRQIIRPDSYDQIHQEYGMHHRVLLMGPVQAPTQIDLAVFRSVSIRPAFEQTRPGSRKGSVLNVGGRAQSMEWLPHVDGHIQYLAVAADSLQPPPRNPAQAPAYNPTQPYASWVQIWRVDTRDSSEASLHTILSTNWGDLKRLHFCALPATKKVPHVLAGLWSDGGLRAIVLPQIQDNDDPSAYALEEPIFVSRAQDTIYTCLNWLSPRRIVAGCANGCAAILDLQDIQHCAKQHGLRPRKYGAVATTFILDIAACAPSSPNHFFTSSMDGFVRLTDTAQSSLSAPSATVPTARARSMLTGCVWNDFLRGVLLIDNSLNVRLHLIRRIFNLISVGRSKTTPTSLATSLCHPFLLVGTAAGDVLASNPFVKVVDTKSYAWNQTWFSHEWRRGNEQDAKAPDAVSQHVSKEGISRFTEGYRPEKVVIVTNSASVNTVYEANSAITSLAWNPNVRVGGWAAAGMANGLVRVEDISLPSG